MGAPKGAPIIHHFRQALFYAILRQPNKLLGEGIRLMDDKKAVIMIKEAVDAITLELGWIEVALKQLEEKRK